MKKKSSKDDRKTCEILSFKQTIELLYDAHFFSGERIKDGFINERDIFAIAEKLNVAHTEWRYVPGWSEFEQGAFEYTPRQLLNICLDDVDYKDEKYIIITMESYLTDKVFIVDDEQFEQFAENYDLLIGCNDLFVQPMDYLFFLLKQKLVIYLNTDGIFTHFKFSPSIN